MPQISLYIDKKTMQKVEKAAKAEKLSISKWVGKQLKKSLKTSYPTDFESLFGSITDESFVEPEKILAEADAKRESL
jgi:hypothetical protein